MKFIIPLILVSLFLYLKSNLINAENLFLNIVPYSTSDCSGSPEGVGYSSILYTCLTYDFNNSYLFSYSSSSNEIKWSSFKSENGEQECKDETVIDSNTFNQEECIPFEKIGNLNDDYDASLLNSFYKLSISSVPFIPSTSYVTSFVSDQCFRGGSNAILYQYFTNETTLGYSSTHSTFFCSYGQPLLNTNSKGIINQGVICQDYPPFYNSSIDVTPSGEQYTGCWTGGLTGSISDSVSSSSSASSSASASSSTGSSYQVAGGLKKKVKNYYPTCYSGSGGNTGESGFSSNDGDPSGSGSTSGSGSGFLSNNNKDEQSTGNGVYTKIDNNKKYYFVSVYCSN